MEKLLKLATDTDILIDAFGIEKTYGGPLMENWIAATGELTANQVAILDDVHRQSFRKVGGWNEEEVKMKLISFLFWNERIIRYYIGSEKFTR